MKTLIVILISISLVSCYSKLKVQEQEKNIFSNQFNKTVENSAFLIKAQNVNKKTLLETFDILEPNIDSVKIQFIDSNKLKLSYGNDSLSQSKIFTGNFTKKNYYEIYFEKHKVIIPIIYSNIYIDRIRLGITPKGNLWVNRYTNTSGNILLLAGGGSIEHTFFFKY